MKTVKAGNYKTDKYYARVVAAVAKLLQAGSVVAPAEVFIAMGLLEAKHLDDWRFGRIPYLERVINCNLAKAERILRLLKLHAAAIGLKDSFTAYRRWGKGPKTPLRFSKTGNPRCELLYSTHYVRKQATASAVDGVQSEQSAECSV